MNNILNENIDFEFSDDFEVIDLGEQELDVYDIEVEDNHNFFANDILIHNSVYLNTDPLIPAMVSIYRPIIEESLKIKDPNILVELEDNNFWDDIVNHFENKTDIVKKYFKAHDVLENNGLTNSCIKVELSKSDNKVFKKYCKNNNLNFIHRRHGKNNTVHYFFFGDDPREFKKNIKNGVGDLVDIKSVVKTYVLDDFANTVIQDIIDTNYSELAEYMNAKNKMVMKRETICINGLWVSKKNYILNVLDNEGVMYAKPKTKITGLLKSHLPASVRSEVKDFLSLVLSKYDPTSLETKVELNDFVTEYRKVFMGLDVKDIGISKTVNNIEKWTDDFGEPKKGTPINSFASIIFNNYIVNKELAQYQMIAEGDKMKYLYLKEPNEWKSHVIGYKDEGLPKEFENWVDKEKMLEKTFYDMISIIVKAMGIELDYSRTSANIMDFLI